MKIYRERNRQCRLGSQRDPETTDSLQRGSVKGWVARFGLIFLLFLLSACAMQRDLVDVQRQLQTTRGELGTIRRGMEADSAEKAKQKASIAEQQAAIARINEQLKTILSTIEAQQQAIVSSSSSLQERLSSIEGKSGEILKKVDERIATGEKGYLVSQGGLGSRLEELAAEVKIVQGKLEENNNLLAEQGMRFDDLNQRASRSGSRVETTESGLKGIKEAQIASGEQIKKVENELKAMQKDWGDRRAIFEKEWVAWRQKADRILGQVADSVKRVEALDIELREIKEAGAKASVSSPPKIQAEPKKEEARASREGTSPAPKAAEVPATEEMGSSTPVGGKKVYDDAYADCLRGEYDLAIAGFRSYLAKYPKGALASNAQYWIGECYYSQKKYDQSIMEFEGVIKNFPESSKVPSALLKEGYAYLELGQVAKGKSFLMEIVKKYPGTREATLAKDRLASLK